MHSFLKLYFAWSSIEIICWYLQLIFKLTTADIRWLYHQIVSIENLAKHCFKKTHFFLNSRSYHRRSRKAKDPRRRVRIHRYWNEDFLVAVQYSRHLRFNELYVWKWKECQQPEFMYNFDLYDQYPRGLFPTAFFLWKHYLVLMPDTGKWELHSILGHLNLFQLGFITWY